VTRKTLTWGHVAFDTSGLFRKIAVRLDSPYVQQIASIRKMPTYAIAYRTSIRRSERANYQLIEQLNFVQNRILYIVSRIRRDFVEKYIEYSSSYSTVNLTGTKLAH
jgi:hypothetical protein